MKSVPPFVPTDSRRITRLVLMTLVLTVFATACQKNDVQKAGASTLGSTIDALVAAATAGDDAALERYQDAKITVIDGSGMTQGVEPYRSKVQGASTNASHASLKNFRVRDLAVHESGDTGWVTYTYRLDAPAVGSSAAGPIFGYATLVMQKTGGDWRIVHSHTTGRPERESDPKF